MKKDLVLERNDHNVTEIEKMFLYLGRSKVRSVIINSEPWFVAKDVCDILGIGNVSLAVNGNPTRNDGGLDDDEKGIYIVHTPGGPQKLLCVSEPGLYSLIFKSRRPEAEAFKDWICHEVLPSIRKTGMYTVHKSESEADLLRQLAAEMDKAKRIRKDLSTKKLLK